MGKMIENQKEKKMKKSELQTAIATFLKKGGRITVAKPATAKGVLPVQMKLTVNRRMISREFSLGYSATNYDRFLNCRQACALGKIAVK